MKFSLCVGKNICVHNNNNVEKLRETTSNTFLIVTCLEFDGHISQILSKPFKVVPNHLQANLDNDKPLSLVDLDDK